MDAFSRNLPARNKKRRRKPQWLDVEYTSSKPLGLIPARILCCHLWPLMGHISKARKKQVGGFKQTCRSNNTESEPHSISHTDDPAMSRSLAKTKPAKGESLVKRSAFWRSDSVLVLFRFHFTSETRKRSQMCRVLKANKTFHKWHIYRLTIPKRIFWFYSPPF